MSEQPFFCNGCGQRVMARAGSMKGRDYRVCSIECLRDVGLRDARSILGKPAHVVGCVCEECENHRSAKATDRG
jgi:hypothetical protein